jgi:hypothetical protein
VEDPLLRDGRIRIIGGRAGVGKSEFSSNYALQLRVLGIRPTLVDLDVVNPYFTTREQRGMFTDAGVSVIGPSEDATANDVPAIPPDIRRIFDPEGGHVVVDLGGDVNGARAFGPYVKRLRPGDHDFFLLVNANRPHHETASEVLEFWTEYEKMSGLTVTGIVNNTHLLRETGADDLRRGELLCRELSALAGVPYRYLVAAEGREGELDFQTQAGAVFRLRQYLRPQWLD